MRIIIALVSGSPKPDKKLFRELQRILCWSSNGEEADRHIHNHQVPVLFIDKLPEDRITPVGTHSNYDGAVRIARHPNISKEDMASTLIHEARHSWQALHFPELFKGRTNIIDSYVAMKLIEYDAWLVEADHQRQVHHSKQYALQKASKETETDIEFNRTYIRLLDNRDAERVTSLLDVSFGQIAANFPDVVPWASYERHYYRPEMMSILASGSFRV